MKIECIGISRADDGASAVLLDSAFSLGDYGMFERGSVKEFLTFALKTLAARLPPGTHCIEYEGKVCFSVVSEERLHVTAICDKEYPARVAISMCRGIATDFEAEFTPRWRTASSEGICHLARLPDTLREYQDPTKVDKIMRVDKSLTETKEVLHKTLEAVLERGEKLETLVEKSDDLSATSKAFYRTAKKTNSCCVVM